MQGLARRVDALRDVEREEGSLPEGLLGDRLIGKRVWDCDLVPETKQKPMDNEQILKRLTKIGYALSNIRDTDALFHIILGQAMDVFSADSGTIYLKHACGSSSSAPATVGKKTGGGGDDFGPCATGADEELEFRDVQNRSMKVEGLHLGRMPVTGSTIPGYCTLAGSVVNIPDAYGLTGSEPYSFSRSFDEKTGYTTRSILAIPMKNKGGEVIGVVTLYNKKRDPDARLLSWEDTERQVVPFTEDDVSLAESIASQAAVALENAFLYRDLRATFEGFVQASVSAVESRDPVTAGHSSRVARLTVELARAVNEVSEGALAGVRFADDQLAELQFAGILHDFGKIGVREAVLVKARKLYDHEFRAIIDRLRILEVSKKQEAAEELLQCAVDRSRQDYEDRRREIERRLQRDLDELRHCARLVSQFNDPAVLRGKEDELPLLEAFSKKTYVDEAGVTCPLLRPEEVKALSILKGSLTDEERREMEGHVRHTYEFLSKIPWSREFLSVPVIAATHHEMLDGSGYTRGLTGEQIPWGARVMAVCDIFDALTATDRPYKKSVPLDRALYIMDMEADNGRLDRNLVDLFSRAKVYEAALPPDNNAVSA